MDVVVPDLGEFSDVEVIEIIVSPGDVVQAESPLITIETDKAAMDVPAPTAGKIVEIKVAAGDRVSAGDAIVVMEAEAQTIELPSPAAGKVWNAQQKGSEQDASDATLVVEGATQVLKHAPGRRSVRIPDLGDFDDVEVIDDQPRGIFRRAAQRAVRRWRFEPIMVNGRATEYRIEHQIDFNLED